MECGSKPFKMAMIRSHDPVDLHNPRASSPEYRDAMGSHSTISRKPIGDDWEAHREKVKELFIDDGSSLSDIQNVLRQTHDFLSYIGDHADLPHLNAIEPAWPLMKKTSTIRGAP